MESKDAPYFVFNSWNCKWQKLEELSQTMKLFFGGSDASDLDSRLWWNGSFKAKMRVLVGPSWLKLCSAFVMAGGRRHFTAENYVIFLWLSLMWLGNFQVVFVQLYLFDGVRCRYGWAFSDSLVHENVSDKPCLQHPTDLPEPAGHRCLWCGFFFETAWLHQNPGSAPAANETEEVAPVFNTA